MGYGTYRANILALHTRYGAWRINGYGVVVADKPSRLRTNGYTCAAIYTGIPSNIKYYGLLHIFLYSLVELK